MLQMYLAASVVLFCASCLWRPTPGYNSFLDGWLFNSISIDVAVLCALRWWENKDRERWAWFCLGGAIAAWTVGGGIWALLLSQTDEPPQPSWADAGWLATYPFAYVAILLLLRGRVNQVPRSIWLDGIVGGLAAAAVGSAIAYKPIADAATGSQLAVAVNLAYPLSDLILLALVVGSFGLNRWRPDRAFVVLGLGLLLFAISDTGYLLAAANGIVQEGTWLDIPWTLGLAALGFAPFVKSERQDTKATDHWTVIGMPIIFGIASLGVLASGRQWDSSSLGAFLASAAVCVAFARMVVTLREVHSLAISREEARTDDLTGLGNRRLFYERAAILLKDRRPEERLALLLVDLDRFKEVNDSLGHHLGDVVLKQMAPRLREALIDASVIARLGGDEFAIVIDGADKEQAQSAAEAIQRALFAPFRLDGLPVKLEASVGVALFPQHGSDANQLLQHADVAMYSAKKSRTGSQIYESISDDQSRERLRAVADLRKNIELHRLLVQYQPKVDAVDGHLVGVEALVRLAHPERGIVPPDEFLPLAEEAGLMRMLTAELLDVVFDDVVRWQENGRSIRVAINLSMTNLLDAEFPTLVEAKISSRGLDGRMFTFEITEDIVLGDPRRARDAAGMLRDLGTQVSLDDYGTGFTSLAYLRELPLDELKLDRSFVSNMDNDPVAEAFVDNAIEVAHLMGLKVVAEGIEDVETWEMIRQAGVDICQGYFFAKPLTAEMLMRYLDDEAERLQGFTLSPVVDRSDSARHFKIN